jgi:hypothetical protein
MAPRIQTECDEMTPFDLERLMIVSFHKDTTAPQLRNHLRAVIKECQRLQGALMIARLPKPTT